MELDRSSDHQLRTALQYVDMHFSDSEAVLILSFLTDNGAYVSTTTEAVSSLVNADTVLELAQQYAARKWEQQKDVLSLHNAYKWSLIQYLPQSKQLRKHAEGNVGPGGVHEGGP